ncbi:MAG: GNAT family N-acetyltransferase [Pseudomonadota bacterium]
MVRYTAEPLPDEADVIALYRANGWSSAEQPVKLMSALANSDHLVCAYDATRLVGLANAISDGSLVVYYPHLLVLPQYQGSGVGRQLMALQMEHYKDFHQHTLLAVAEAASFYERVGFKKADGIVAMWVYEGGDH